MGGLEVSKMKDDEEMSRKNAEEMIEKLKQESKDKVCLNMSPSLHIVIRPIAQTFTSTKFSIYVRKYFNGIYDNLTIIFFLCLQ